MQIKKSVLKNFITVIGIIAIITISFLLIKNLSTNSSTSNSQNVVSDIDGKQIIDLTAKGGYKPSVIEAVGNKETILRVNTNNTFDCSSALLIPSLKISKNLPITGKTEINLGVQQSGTELDGTCTMGMYNFKIKFS